MKRKMALAFLLGISIAVMGVAAWHVTRPSVADNLSTQANGMLNQWKAPTPSTTVGRRVGNNLPASVKETEPRAGNKFAVIRIPAMKLTFPIAEGTDDATLVTAIGHYVQTALPGQVGNFSIAGHDCCESNGQPFKKLSTLHAGNVVYVDTKNATYKYTVVDNTSCGVSPTVVPMNRSEVINPNPCTDTVPTRKLMTLQTCTPVTHGHSAYRVIVWAELASVTPRS